jgi:hypothetical protein
LADKDDGFTKSGCGIGWGKLASVEELLNGRDFISDDAVSVELRCCLVETTFENRPFAVGWYRKFIKDYSTIARLLIRLLEKYVTFTWGKSKMMHSRHELVKAPVLAQPNPTRPFVVTTDASKVGLGG